MNLFTGHKKGGLIQCRVCGTENHVATHTNKVRPVCGKCKAPLDVEAAGNRTAISKATILYAALYLASAGFGAGICWWRLAAEYQTREIAWTRTLNEARSSVDKLQNELRNHESNVAALRSEKTRLASNTQSDQRRINELLAEIKRLNDQIKDAQKPSPTPSSSAPTRPEVFAPLSQVKPTPTVDTLLPGDVRVPHGMTEFNVPQNGRGEISIQNGGSTDAVAKLVDPSTGRLIAICSVQTGRSFSLTRIPEGTYTLVFATGWDWNNAKGKFNRADTFRAFLEPFRFTVQRRYTGTETRGGNVYDTYADYSNTYRVTLNPVVGGTAKTRSISADEFYGYGQ